MKRTATLVAGLLLVTGTVFAAPTVTATGSVEYKNTVFATDAPILQNVKGDDTVGLTVTTDVKFDAKNSLGLTVKEGNDDTLKLEYKYDGDKTDVTFDTISDKGEKAALFQTVNVTATHTEGNVKAQVKGKLLQTAAQTAGVSTAMSESDFAVNTDADAVFLEYKVTPSITTTFYPYATKFGVDSVFNDDEEVGELKGINDKVAPTKDYSKSETITEAVAGVKVAFTAGAAKGLSVKVGTDKDLKSPVPTSGATADATFFVDAEYSKTVAGFTGKVDFAMTTDKDQAVKQNVMLDVTGKVATVAVQGQLFQATGKVKADDVQAVYGKASTTVAGFGLVAEGSMKKLGENKALLGVYLEANKTFAKINEIEPKVTVSFKDVDINTTDAGKAVPTTITAKVDAKIVKDKITVTPALEIANKTVSGTAKTSTSATVAVKYSF